jgi:hypothetical protein
LRRISAGVGDVGARDLDGLGVWRAEFAEAMEFSEGPGLGAFEAGFGALDVGQFFVDALLVQAEAEVVIAVAIFAVILGLVIVETFVGDGSGDGPGAAETPFGDGDALDEMEFKDGGGLERIDIILLELVEESAIFCAEYDGAGGKAVFYGVL